MKATAIFLLAVSHVAVGIGGWVLARGGPARSLVATAEDGDSVSRSTELASLDASSTNPILRATSADFRAAWGVMMRGERDEQGEPHPKSLSLFVDWCQLDPEGAILGLQDLYAPRFGHNYLGNAVGAHGAEIAEALVRHWRGLKYQMDIKVSGAIAKALSKLVLVDRERAIGLLFEVPSGIRQGAYGALFDELPADEVTDLGERLMERYSEMEPGYDRQRFWENYGYAMARVDPEGGLYELLARVEDPKGFEVLVTESIRDARHNERWSRLLATLGEIDGERRAQIEEQVVVRCTQDVASSGRLLPFLEACHSTGQSRVAELVNLGSRLDGQTPGDPPAAFLDWAVALEGEVVVEVRMAVDFALRSDTEGTFGWIEEQPAGAARDRILLAGIERLAEDGSQHAALRDWLDLFQSPQVRREAERLLEAE